jgi:hypothetical protein
MDIERLVKETYGNIQHGKQKEMQESVPEYRVVYKS